MRLASPIALLVALALATALPDQAVRAQQKFELPPLSPNAALQYWQAFGTLPAFDADQEKRLENWSTTQLGPATAKLLDGSRTSLMFLRRAAPMRECDWGLDYSEGISMHLPHLAKARTLARVAALDARRALASGDTHAAGEDILGMMALARQVGRDYTLVSTLVCYAIEGMVIDLVAPQVPDLGLSYDDAVKGFESLPPAPSLVQATECERRMSQSIIEQLKRAEEQRRGSWRETWKAMLGPDSKDPAANVESLDELLKMVADFRVVYDELGELIQLPPKEFDAKYPDFVKRAQAASPMTDFTLPAMDKVIATKRRAEVRLAMMLAAIAVAEGGPEKLADIQDPFGDGPFTYRKLDDGFELSSQLVNEGQPVTLVIGPAAAAK